ncbi:carbohydrate ABC transporter permease [Gracilinema caldarium]|uniref:ABC-type transporter, integral membrane subunit n=1 Tax=Gracilinema caldarium (strain ATCC 51460 / DSM 7334 / H1) TaxID=744872 RepID=F8EYS2_GRAC1|nr:sugar ABC transporter permease [Gracilinema caldarium]AEJ18868.1 ABC-type transporter, integral membrane subunit [Gracilinema caldarium DSM 7334]
MIVTVKKSVNQIITTKYAPYFFVAPFIISFLIFFLYPLISTVIMSTQEILGPEDVTFIGLQNYKNLANEQFLRAIENSTIYTILTIIILIPLPLILAILITNKPTKGRTFFKSAYFLPALTSVVVAGIFFRFAFSAQHTALVNSILINIGAKPHDWLFKRWSTMLILVLFCTWRWLGVNVIYFLSGLSAIPPEQYESADIDGASKLQKLFFITIPNLKPTIVYVVTISIYGGFAMFAETYTMFGTAASPGDIGLTLVSYIYLEGFNYANLGMGSAIGVALFVIIMTVNIIQLIFTGTFKKKGA